MTSSADARNAPSGVIRVRALDDAGRPVWFGVARSPDGTDPPVQELPEADARRALGDEWQCIAHLDAEGSPQRLESPDDLYPRAPKLWGVVVTDPGPPAAMSFVAFTGHDVPEGAVLDPDRAAALGVRSEDQVGAVRCYTETGEVDQVYVAPAWRRKQIATALVGAASVYNMAHDRPPTWGDGQRTALGEKWVQSLPSRARVADQTHLAPPMTPMDER